MRTDRDKGSPNNNSTSALGINHLGPWAFISHPAILRADQGRVVTVTSTAHHFGLSVDPDNPHLRGNYGAWKACGQAKLANYHFGIGLQRQFESAGVGAQSLIAHPGLTNSELQATTVSEGGGGILGPVFHWLARLTGMSVEEGVRPQLRAATDPNAKGGEFYGPIAVNNGQAVRKPILRRIGMDEAIRTLWAVSERETNRSIDVTSRGL